MDLGISEIWGYRDSGDLGISDLRPRMVDPGIHDIHEVRLLDIESQTHASSVCPSVCSGMAGKVER